MKFRVSFVPSIFITFLVLVARASFAVPEPVDVVGHTVVAYFPSVTQQEVNADQNLSETLGDFQFHLQMVEPCLKKSSSLSLRDTVRPLNFVMTNRYIWGSGIHHVDH